MRNFYFISLYPDAIRAYCECGLFKKAAQDQKIKLHFIQLRDYAVDKHGSIDDRPYGGGAGMVLRAEPLSQAVKKIRQHDPQALVLLPDPKAPSWNQSLAEKFSQLPTSLIFICGRFEGIDQRFIDLYVDHSFSIGSFVISGGEIAALGIAESLVRLMTLKEDSLSDSFSSSLNRQLEYPQYTRPEVFEDLAVPKALLSGNHQKIAEWRKQHTPKTS